MPRTKPDIYQIDTAGGSEGQVIKIVGGVPTWSSDSSGYTSSNFVDAETPSGAVDGVNVLFGLSSAAVGSASIHLFLDGIRLLSGSANDYTVDVDNRSITMMYPPHTNQNFFADYRL